MAEPDPAALVVYSDYVCPFCFLGKRSLETFLDEAEDPPRVEWRPYDLRLHRRNAEGDIDPSTNSQKSEAYFEQANANVQRLAEAYGVEMRLDVGRDVDGWDAHKLALFTLEEHGAQRFEQLHEAIFEALWQDGRDIGDPRVLVELAGRVGLAAEEVGTVLDGQAWEERVREAFEQAHRAGITGVPTFCYRQLRVPGAIAADDIARIVENG